MELPKDLVLVVGPSWVGDMVMAQSLFARLKQVRPEAQIHVLAPAWSLPILQRMPEVRAGIPMPLGHGEFGFAQRRQLGHALGMTRYSQSIVLPGSWKSALIPYFANIPRRTGFRGEMRYGLLNDIRRLDKNLLKTTVQRFVALAEEKSVTTVPEIPLPRLRASPERGLALMQALDLKAGQSAVAMMPGAEYGPAKQWPAEAYGALAGLLAQQGIQSWVFGSKKETELGEQIRAASGDTAINLCGKTQLGDVVDLLAQCKAAVSNDSGLMHVAAATDVPVVAIYGSSTPDFTPPLTDKKHIHYLRLECSPCFERTCPLGHTRCLKEITPESVRASLRTLAGL